MSETIDGSLDQDFERVARELGPFEFNQPVGCCLIASDQPHQFIECNRAGSWNFALKPRSGNCILLRFDLFLRGVISACEMEQYIIKMADGILNVRRNILPPAEPGIPCLDELFPVIHEDRADDSVCIACQRQRLMIGSEGHLLDQLQVPG